MRKSKPIPTKVFNHVKFSNGAKPGASLKVDDITYILEPGPNYPIKAKKYVPGNWRGKAVKLSGIPARPANDWDIYFTHEN